jgi:transcriptional regulator with XRE-family HTH domain
MSDYAKMTFVFGREMGARLRALRRLRKLSLRELASLMDRQGAGPTTSSENRESGPGFRRLTITT